jgi:Delta3,5-Delta2,4-dienoyl-CoA isomerase
MWLEMRRLFDQLSCDSAVRVIVLSGAGDSAFSTGLDLQAAAEAGLGHLGNPSRDPSREAVLLRRHIVEFQDCISAVERCEKPVIVAMHGHVLGLAIDLATAGDIRVCARGTAFGIKEVDIGLAADVGTLTRLPKVIGASGWVKEMALTGRIFGPDEALRVGLVNSIHESKPSMLRAALDMAVLIASKSPVAVQGTKELLNWSRDHTVQDGECRTRATEKNEKAKREGETHESSYPFPSDWS